MKKYVINLLTAKDRLEAVSKEFDRVGLEVEVVIPLPATKIPNTNRESWSKGAMSLRETTISIIEKALSDNEEMIMIFEDDTYIRDDIWKQFQKDFDLFSKKIEFNFIHLNYSAGERFSMQSSYNFQMTYDGVECCQCYIINKRIMKTFLEHLKANVVPIDVITKYLHSKFKNSFVYSPCPVYHKPNQFSTIRNKIVDY